MPWKQVASVHLDGAEAADVVRAAAAMVDRADLGDDDAEFAVGSAEDIALAWYAPGEVAYLLEDLDSAELSPARGLTGRRRTRTPGTAEWPNARFEVCAVGSSAMARVIKRGAIRRAW